MVTKDILESSASIKIAKILFTALEKKLWTYALIEWNMFQLIHQ